MSQQHESLIHSDIPAAHAVEDLSRCPAATVRLGSCGDDGGLVLGRTANRCMDGLSKDRESLHMAAAAECVWQPSQIEAYSQKVATKPSAFKSRNDSS